MEESSDPINHTKGIPRRSSRTHISMSDTESTTSQIDSFHSPLRSENDEPAENNCRTIVLAGTYSSLVPSPEKSNLSASSPPTGENFRRPWLRSERPASEDLDSPESPRGGDEGKDVRRSLHRTPAPESLGFPENRAAAAVGVSKFVKVGAGDGRGLEEGLRGGDEVGGERAAILKRSERNAVAKKVGLGLRAFEVIACLVSFSVMASDKTQGWSGDSFNRYIEYRYCLAVNVIGFVYSGFQAFDLSFQLAMGKHLVYHHHLRHHFDFATDQILAYLLMSASSSAATRVDDWISNWGGDEFTLIASSSVAVSVLAFIAFALSALVSGYNLSNQDST